ncbi:retinoid-binding protein 7 [Cynoglossus semilaevis]|uniref:Cellular retinoic acid-binding protein 1 n=1 Tax=Cynoglossus semilaevis TaxID=244447 RepID=A0A3P8X7A0_CYNSE|nr:retinoid-binding protein 7 [Cynoglossus semilaevis]
MTAEMTVDYSGTWDIISNVNFDGYMIALDNDYATRKLAKMLSPQKVIKQEGDSFTIKTVTAFRNYECSFTIGQEFTEVTSGMDNRSCQSVVTWDDNKLVCVQNGQKKNRGWTHWIEEDQLFLELTCENHVCRQVYKRKP